MTIGFYYHIPIVSNNNRLFVPGYLGVFLDALASEVNLLYLFMHDAGAHTIAEADYELTQKNIEFISLGNITPAWHRHLFHKKILRKIEPGAKICDTIIIRSPTPLAPFFKNHVSPQKLLFMVVGDYLEGATQYKIKSARDWVMIQYLKRNDILFKKSMLHTDVLVNSPGLLNKYKDISKSIHLIKTTTLSKNDFFERTDTCKNEVIELLYTGRIEAAKGLFELVAAIAQLRKQGRDVRLNIAGWEADAKQTVEKALLDLAADLEIVPQIVFHGKKKIGAELNEMYRKADIYIIPSYHEGFPRTIWEAMANSLPVITSNVGGIPDYLTNLEDAVFVTPKSVGDLVEKITLLIENRQLRSKLIRNAFLLAKSNTTEIQTKNIMKIIDQLLLVN